MSSMRRTMRRRMGRGYVPPSPAVLAILEAAIAEQRAEFGRRGGMSAVRAAIEAALTRNDAALRALGPE